MGLIDIVVFVGFIAAVVAVGLTKGRAGKGEEKDAQDFFLAGRGLSWWLIGFSLIAANISTEEAAKAAGADTASLTLVLYVVFSPLGLAK